MTSAVEKLLSILNIPEGILASTLGMTVKSLTAIKEDSTNASQEKRKRVIDLMTLVTTAQNMGVPRDIIFNILGEPIRELNDRTMLYYIVDSPGLYPIDELSKIAVYEFLNSP